jgi:hypothetical protein
MNQTILLISAMTGVQNCAANLSNQLSSSVDIAIDRKDGIALLKRQPYSVVIVDESIAEADARGADMPGLRFLCRSTLLFPVRHDWPAIFGLPSAAGSRSRRSRCVPQLPRLKVN